MKRRKQLVFATDITAVNLKKLPVTGSIPIDIGRHDIRKEYLKLRHYLNGLYKLITPGFNAPLIIFPSVILSDWPFVFFAVPEKVPFTILFTVSTSVITKEPLTNE